MSKAIDFAQTVFAFLAVLGLAMWIGMIMKATPEDKLVEACKPIEFGADALHDVTTGLTGYPPTWTTNLKVYLMGGCYYFFSIVLRDNDAELEGSGVRTR